MNFNLVVDTSNFKPFTFLEKIAPLLLYKEAYEKLQEKMEKYSELLADIDPNLFKTLAYRDEILQFNNSFRRASDSFSRGMTRENRLMLNRLFINDRLGMKKYQDAIKLRNEWINKAMAGGNDLTWNVNDGSADRFVGLDAANIRAISSTDTINKAIKMATGIYNTLTDVDRLNISKDLKLGIRFYQDKDRSISEALNATLNDMEINNDNPEALRVVESIRNAMNIVKKGTGVEDSKYGFDKSALDKVANDILQGFISAYENPVKPFEDKSRDVALYEATYKTEVDPNTGELSVTGWNTENPIGKHAKTVADLQELDARSLIAYRDKSTSLLGRRGGGGHGGHGGSHSSNNESSGVSSGDTVLYDPKNKGKSGGQEVSGDWEIVGDYQPIDYSFSSDQLSYDGHTATSQVKVRNIHTKKEKTVLVGVKDSKSKSKSNGGKKGTPSGPPPSDM